LSNPLSSLSNIPSSLSAIPSDNRTAPSNSVQFTDLLNEIAMPELKAEDETYKANREAHFQGEAINKWEPKSLRPRHREMMRRILEGATYGEIACDMGIHPQTVMLVASSAIFKEELTIMEREANFQVIRRAEDLSNEALDKLKGLMRRARSEALQASCAERVLGIAGYSKIEKKQIAVVSGEDVIRELNRRRREAFDAGFGGDPRGGSPSGSSLSNKAVNFSVDSTD
jgi:hypothetical protein